MLLDWNHSLFCNYFVQTSDACSIDRIPAVFEDCWWIWDVWRASFKELEWKSENIQHPHSRNRDNSRWKVATKWRFSDGVLPALPTYSIKSCWAKTLKIGDCRGWVNAGVWVSCLSKTQPFGNTSRHLIGYWFYLEVNKRALFKLVEPAVWVWVALDPRLPPSPLTFCWHAHCILSNPKAICGLWV